MPGKNPFNGIERHLKFRAYISLEIDVNPFNGIERHPGEIDNLLGIVRESIQWN